MFRIITGQDEIRVYSDYTGRLTYLSAVNESSSEIPGKLIMYGRKKEWLPWLLSWVSCFFAYSRLHWIPS